MPLNSSASGGYLSQTNALPAADTQLEDQLQEFIVGVTGLPGNMVRPRWQPNLAVIPSATANWAAIGITEIQPIGGGGELDYERHIPDGNGHDELHEHEEIVLIATFYGPACGANARKFRTGLKIAQNWEAVSIHGIDLGEIGPIRFLPEQVDDVWYHRADIELRLRREVISSFDIQNILSAQGTIHGDSHETEITQDWNTEDV
jgi:hypothetical protein